MNAIIDKLLERASHAPNTLEAPAPSHSQIEQIIQCALSAPDHGKLRLWHFVVIEGDARLALGKATAEGAAIADHNLDEDKLALMRGKTLRSPLIIACVLKTVADHPKIPVFEQLLSTGAAIQQLQLAANALGFGAIWLSGAHCNSAPVKKLLGAAEEHTVAGYIYLGPPTKLAPAKQRPAPSEHMSFLSS